MKTVTTTVNSNHLLETQVKDVITSAKSKITQLQSEIDSLNSEYEQVNFQVEQAQAQKREVVDKNRQMQDQLRRVKLENEDLAKRKVELTQELKRAKEDLSSLIEKGE